MLEKYKPFERRACYYETDRMGVVHNSNYFRWFEECRVDFLDQAGYPYAKMEEEGLFIPVLSAFCEYKSSVLFGDAVIILPKIEYFNGFKMTVTYKIIKKRDDTLAALGETKHCMTTKNFVPVRTKRDFPEIYEVFSRYAGADLP